MHGCQKGIIDNKSPFSRNTKNHKLGLMNLIKHIRLNLPADCDRMQNKITKLDNFIVFTYNLFCPGILLGNVD